MQKFIPAKTVDEAYQACHPELPLEAGDSRYVDLTFVRGNQNLVDAISRRIRRTKSPIYHKQLITGHRGCGKSTELKQLVARLRDQKFFAVYVDVENTLDLGDLNYLDVLVALAKGISEAMNSEGISISKGLLKNLDDWFAEKILREEEKEDIETVLEAEFSVKPEIPLLTRMLAAFTGQIRSGSTRKIEIRRELEREINVFLNRLNDLIDDARIQLHRKGWKDLVAIVDGLEKMHYKIYPDGQSSHSELFVQHAEQLKAPRCHILYTVPISLLFNVYIGDSFAETDVIHMVKIKEFETNKDFQKGMDTLYEVIARRIDIQAIFQESKLVKRLIKASGGSVRDLMRLLRFACDETDTQIGPEHVDHAIQRLVQEYDRLVKEEDISMLAHIARSHRIPGDETSGRLLHHRLVLEYVNKQRWADLHPAVRLCPRVKDALKK